jgi:hypothetical protein
LRHDVGGKLLANRGQAFSDQLAVAIDVGIPLELDINDRKTHARNRAYARHPGHAIHQGFDRKADPQLHFGRSETLRFGHDRDRRPVEVGKYIDRQLPHREKAEDDQGEAQRQDQEPVAKGLGDEKGEHSEAA